MSDSNPSPSFPSAGYVQGQLQRVRAQLLDDFERDYANTVQEAINILEVVKKIDSFTTLPSTDNLCPPLPGL